MSTTVTPFLMFEGKAEAAMTFYVSLIPDAAVTNIVRYGPGEPGPEGSVMRATFRLAGRDFMCIDSPAKHAFSFTPAISLFIECDSEGEVERLFAALSEGGGILMPLASYPFSRKFGWVNDRFGVSWQIYLRDDAAGT
jgi:predicted 3-demethylubiquinone-9 3-methyltransferase (glyoxalase superfamily)